MNTTPDASATLREPASLGMDATVRWSRGVESDAACGQLRLRSALGR